jgi:hypothetical protein
MYFRKLLVVWNGCLGPVLRMLILTKLMILGYDLIDYLLLLYPVTIRYHKA